MNKLRQWKYIFALLFLIVIPSLLLAYFGVRAIESERRAYQKQLSESYLRLAQFGSSSLYNRFQTISDSWNNLLSLPNFLNLSNENQQQVLAQFIRNNPLISSAYLINSKSDIIFPLRLANINKKPTDDSSLRESSIKEWLIKYNRLNENAEAMIFENARPDSAILMYREALRIFPIPKIRAMALNEMANIYLSQADWQNAFISYRQIINSFPNERDLNNLHLRFYSKYQSSRALENLERLSRGNAIIN